MNKPKEWPAVAAAIAALIFTAMAIIGAGYGALHAHPGIYRTDTIYRKH